MNFLRFPLDPAETLGFIGNIQMLGDAFDGPKRFDFGFRLARYGHYLLRLGCGV